MKPTIIFTGIFAIASVIGCSQKTEQQEPQKTEQTVETSQNHRAADSNQAHHGEMPDMGESNQAMIEKLGPADKNYEDRFIDMMIPHHEGAILMAKDALKKTSRPELKLLAENILAAQEKEIALMKELRKKWYGH